MTRRCGPVVALLLGGCFHDLGGGGDVGSSTSATTTSASASTTSESNTGTSSTSSGSTGTSSTGTSSTGTSSASTSSASTSSTGTSSASTSSASDTDAPADLGGPGFGCPVHPDLVACYPFEDGWDAQLLVDAAGDHDGTMIGAAPTDGVHGLAAETDASAALSVPAALAPLGGAPWTTMAWVRLDQAPTVRAGVLDRDGDYGLFLGPTGEVECSSLTGVTPIQPGVWTHIACVERADLLEIYVDGVFDAALKLNSDAPPEGQPLVLANDSPPSAAEALVGAIDEVMLWRRSLTQAEICAAAGLCP
ncbi:MAG: LamG domain-containing protein [Nannocystaceae bacterium]